MSDSDGKDLEEKDSKKDTAELLRSAMKGSTPPSGKDLSTARPGRNQGFLSGAGRSCGRRAGRKR